MKINNPSFGTLILGFLGIFIALVLFATKATESSEIYLVILAVGLLLVACSGMVASWVVVFLGATVNGISINLGFLTVRPEHLTAAVFLILIYHMRLSIPAAVQKSRVPLICLASGFILWAAVVSLGSPNPAASLWIVLQYALGIVWLLPFATVSDAKLTLVRAGTYIFACVTLLSLISYAARTLGSGSLLGVSPVSGRLQGFSFEPNIFASQAVVWLGVLYFWRSSLCRLDKIASAVIVVGVLFAGTRSAWLAAVAVVALGLLNVLRRGSARSVLLGGVIGIVGVAAPFLISTLAAAGVLGTEITYRLQNLLESDSGTGAYRIDNFELAFGDLSSWDAWWVGLGANSFSQYHAIDSTGTGPAYLGSLWITLVYDSGFIGLALFLGLFFALWRLTERRPESLAVFVAIAICAAFTNFLWFQYAWLSLAMVVGRADQTDYPKFDDKLNSTISLGGRQ
ncbi:O-antigen ligase family protein [Arthrobacter sp. CJ23]|uniref:O-antigen ligase family protein n=1 Tax=Arthrobacter sp. CJ23 TaxID=2972479 RepID=UPI00215CAC0E|nr:O-antigen ligase family protein [Arthrobacter sp. CJ23]UVJ38739.1 O-antigen ligase family protein [Arthrobacter sp. CJ23]